MHDSCRTAYASRRGAMLVLVAIVLILIIIGAVFSVDVAYMHMVRAELRTATDAAARAGSEALARTQDPAQARAAAVEIASRNRVAGKGLSLDAEDITLGSISETSSGRFEFLPNQTPLTAVRVNGRRDDLSLDGSVGLFFAKVFSAKDFQPTEFATAASNVRDVALVLDISGSMGSPSGGGTRLSALKEAVRVFLAEIASSSPNTRVSLTAYSTQPFKVADLSADFGSIQNRVDNFGAGGLTAIGNALLVGSDSLENDPLNRAFARKTIVLMTDGNHNRGPSPTSTVQTAIDRDQQVHTITFSSGANQGLMRSVASRTDGGIHLHADEAGDLAAAFREIAKALSVLLIE